MYVALRNALTACRIPLVVGVAYFVLALSALFATKGADGIATVWPSSGAVVAALLLAPGRRTGILVAAAIASMLANLISGTGFALSAGFTGANLLEALIACTIMRGIGPANESFFSYNNVVRFLAGAVIAGTVSAALASLLAGDFSGHMFISWFATVTLGIMIVVPLVMNFAKSGTAGLPLPRIRRALPILGIMTITTAVVFWQSDYPLLFLPLLAVVLGTYILGPMGATAGIVMIAVLGSAATWYGHGPMTLLHSRHPLAAVLFFQFYLFTLIGAALPLTALLNMRSLQFRQILRGKRWLEMSEHLAGVGHWRLNLTNDHLFWSDEVYRIHGVEPGLPISVASAMEFYHVDDRDRINDLITHTIETNVPYEFQAKIRRQDGEIRHLFSRGEVEVANGRAIAIFGICRDITEQVMTTRELAEARVQAESDAKTAMELAETDVLTSIANRRKAMAVLNAEVARAEATGSPLSIALLDIDHFKSVNDRLGHAGGDEVIRRIAQTCVATLRGTDFVGRLGGEEFVLILPGSDTDVAVMVAERVRKAIEKLEWAPLDLPGVTVSIGLTNHGPGRDGDSLLQEADAALYRAKREGRNRLRMAA